MTEETSNPEVNETDEAPAVDELSLLKERARTLGIPLGGNIGLDALKKKIAAKLAGEKEEPEEEVEEETAAPKRKLSKAEAEQAVREKLQKDKMALVRCRIYNLNPSKRDLQGEIITVANKFLGTVRKFIPFGEQTDNGYHIPKVIYEDLVRRQYQHVKTKRVKGNIEVDTRMVPEYNIEVLEPLSAEELKDLAMRQSAAERLGA